MADKQAYEQWQDKAAKAKGIITEHSLPLWQRAHLAGGMYGGLELDGLRSKHRHKILSGFGKINRILARYTLNSFEDYENIKDEDLREIIQIISSLSPPK